jgi:hypothetical protein
MWALKKIVIQKQRELDERQLNAACAMVDEKHPLWQAIHQLIDTARENALENADQNMDPPGILAGYVGGAAHLKMLGEDLHVRRQAGFATETASQMGRNDRVAKGQRRAEIRGAPIYRRGQDQTAHIAAQQRPPLQRRGNSARDPGHAQMLMARK